MNTLILEPASFPVFNSEISDLDYRRYFANITTKCGKKLRIEISDTDDLTLCLKPCFADKNEGCQSLKEREFFDDINAKNYYFCMADLLKCINDFSDAQYDSIIYMRRGELDDTIYLPASFSYKEVSSF